MQTSTITTTTTQTTTQPTMVDCVQIQKGMDITIFELWNGCPACREMNGHPVGEPGFFMILIQSKTFPDNTPATEINEAELNNEPTSVVQGPFIDEEAGTAVLEAITTQNQEFVV